MSSRAQLLAHCPWGNINMASIRGLKKTDLNCALRKLHLVYTSKTEYHVLKTIINRSIQGFDISSQNIITK